MRKLNIIIFILFLGFVCNAQMYSSVIGLSFPPCGIKAITGTLSVNAGSTTQLTDASIGGTWSSSTTTVATVNSSGLVTGVASGTSTISYSLSNYCLTTSVVTVAASFTTLDPSKKGSGVTLSGSNLTYAVTNGSNYCALSIVGISSSSTNPKIVFEVTYNSFTTAIQIGIGKSTINFAAFLGNDASGVSINGAGNVITNGTNYGAYTNTPVAGDTYMVAINMTTGKMWISKKDGTWVGGSDPSGTATTVNSIITGNPTFTGTWYAGVGNFGNANITVNFGATAFVHTVPSGFHAGLP